MRPAAIALFASIGLTGCAADDESVTSTSTTTTTSTSSLPDAPGVDPAGCPVGDEAFCAVAVGATEALIDGDSDALLGLSRPGTIVCAEMAQEYFPACATDAVLEGYGLSGPNLLVEIVPEAAYAEALAAMTAGARDVQLLGVGTCGPDVPGQRTYHLASTFESGGDAASQPAVASFEFTFDETWRIALVYTGALTEWEAAGADPFLDSFCEAGRTPWG